MNSETNTGILPPEGEESAEFENVNATPENSATNSNNSNTPLANVPALNANDEAVENAIEVPATAMNAVEALPPTTTKAKKPQSVAQQQTIAKQAQERAALKNAGLAKPKIDVVATLASMKAKGDTKYETAFANALAGRPLNSYRTAKKTKARKNTVTNATNGPAGVFSRNALGNVNSSMRNTKKTKKKGVNSGTQAISRGTAASIQTNMRSRNMMNATVTSGTVDAVLDIAESIGKQLGEMKRMIKTLKAKRTRGPRVSTSRASNNSLLTLPPPSGLNAGLSTVYEGATGEENNTFNDFTPPP
jgi:hypothetical protein